MQRIGMFQANTPMARPVPRTAAAAPLRAPVGDRLALSTPTTHNSVELHVRPEATMDALLAQIRGAKHSFLIETFIWKDDDAGREVARALVERKRQAAARGEVFEARVLIDACGLRDQPKGGSFQHLRELMEAAGVEVEVFNRGYVSLAAMGVPITHRKLYIADGASFMTGGRNLADEYLKPTFGPTATPSWHDLAYTIRGPEAARITRLFYDHWTQAGGTAPATLPAPVAAPGGQARVHLIETDPVRHDQGVRQAHDALIRSARQEIVAIYPYFTDDHLVEQLIAAKRARPELAVRVILPGGSEGGLMNFFPYLHAETARQLLAAGIEVRSWNGRNEAGQFVERWSHLKGLMIDGQTLSIGSANGDARTFDANYELNTVIEDPATLEAFRRQVVDPDWAAARPITQAELDARPWYRKLWARVLEWFDFLA